MNSKSFSLLAPFLLLLMLVCIPTRTLGAEIEIQQPAGCAAQPLYKCQSHRIYHGSGEAPTQWNLENLSKPADGSAINYEIFYADGTHSTGRLRGGQSTVIQGKVHRIVVHEIQAEVSSVQLCPAVVKG